MSETKVRLGKQVESWGTNHDTSVPLIHFLEYFVVQVASASQCHLHTDNNFGDIEHMPCYILQAMQTEICKCFKDIVILKLQI